MKKFAIYIHVPWCRRRCPYCDFYFVVGKPNQQFATALLKEWQNRKHHYFDIPADSLYFGGGTPSLLDPTVLNEIISFFKDTHALKNEAEITLEVNPEDVVDNDYALRLFSSGVNRISLGAQSFSDDILKVLGRKHSAAQAKDAIDHLLNANFRNISIDFILGVKGENKNDIIQHLKYFKERKIPHFSTYLLTIEERTRFFRLIKEGKMNPPDEDTQVAIYRLVQNFLLELGYVQYDISSYAQSNFFSRHNQVYWAAGNYIGLGPGAHSMRLLSDGSIERSHTTSDLVTWLAETKHQDHVSIDRLAPLDALKESLAFGLRNMAVGIEPEVLAERHQTITPPSFFTAVEKLKNIGWLEEHDQKLKINSYGALFADNIMREILCC